jgi:hypothetical protein
MRRIVYGQDRARPQDSRSAAFADDTAKLEANLRKRRSLVPVVTAMAALVCFGAIVWYAYTWGTGQMASDELPVVRAEQMPEKVKPDQPGGLDVPHQGIGLLNDGAEGERTAKVERLLPLPEIPNPPPPLENTAGQSAQLPPEEPMPEPVAEAPLMAGEPPADVAEPSQMATAEMAKPLPKPDAAPAEDQDQIAELLNQAPMETANGDSGGGEAAKEAASSPGRQVAALTAGDVVVQLASVKSQAAASQEWARLQKAHPGLLGSLPLSLETAQVKGATYYRVQTGPFPSRTAAADFCAQLKAQKQDCLVKQR